MSLNENKIITTIKTYFTYSPMEANSIIPTTFKTKLMDWLQKKPDAIGLGNDPKYTYDMIVKLLLAYQEVDSKQGQIPQGKESKRKDSRPKTNTAEPQLSNVDFTFLFHFLNLTLGEVYSAYQTYYRQFDSDDSLKLEEGEFYQMLEYLAKPENMGEEKIKKSFETTSPKDFKMYNKVAKVHPSFNIKKGMFTLLSVQDSNILGGKPYVHCLKFFPLLFSYFGEHLKRRVHGRLSTLQQAIGLSSSRHRIKGDAASFVEKLDSLGCKYESDSHNLRVSFSTLEKAVILFRNSYSDVFGREQLELVIKELQVKCKLEANSDKEEDIYPLTYRLISWIVYRISLHSSLALLSKEKAPKKLSRSELLEEYTCWAAAYNYENFNKKWIDEKFKKQLVKKLEGKVLTNIRSEETKGIVLSALKGFCRKLMPHMSDQCIEKMYEILVLKMGNVAVDENLMERLSDCAFDLLVDVAENKLSELIDTVFKSLNAEPKEKKEKKAWFSYGKSRELQQITTMSISCKKPDNTEKEQVQTPEFSKSASSLEQESFSMAESRVEMIQKETKQLEDEDDNDDFAALSIHSLDSESPDPVPSENVIEFNHQAPLNHNLSKSNPVTSTKLDDTPARNRNRPFLKLEPVRLSLESRKLHNHTAKSKPHSSTSSISNDSDSRTSKSMLRSDSGLFNEHTQRKVDVVKSVLIAQTFLKNYAENSASGKYEKRRTLALEMLSKSEKLPLRNSDASFHMDKSMNASYRKVKSNNTSFRMDKTKERRKSINKAQIETQLTQGTQATCSRTRLDTQAQTVDTETYLASTTHKKTNSSKFYVNPLDKQISPDQLRAGISKIKKESKEGCNETLNRSNGSLGVAKEDPFEELLKDYQIKESEQMKFRKREELNKREGYLCCGSKQSCTIF